MNMLLSSAQTLPLWVGKPGSKPPPLCGCIPAESSYVAKVFLTHFLTIEYLETNKKSVFLF